MGRLGIGTLALVVLVYAITRDTVTALLASAAGAILSGVLDDALHDWLESLAPANRAQRRLARAVESAVRQRSAALRDEPDERAA